MSRLFEEKRPLRPQSIASRQMAPPLVSLSPCETSRTNLGRSCSCNDSVTRDEDLDVNNAQVIDDLSINRWLMRIMRLGENYISIGSNGYKTAASKSFSSSQCHSGFLAPQRPVSRRFSACESPAFLKPPQLFRGRRFSDEINQIGQGNHGRAPSYRRRGKLKVIK